MPFKIILNILILLAIIIRCDASDAPFTEEEFIKRTKGLLNIRMPLPDKSLVARPHAQSPGSLASYDAKVQKIQARMDDPELIALRAILLCENQQNMSAKTFMGLWTRVYDHLQSPKEFLYLWYMHRGKFNKKYDNSVVQSKYINLINKLRQIYTTKCIDGSNEAYLKVYGWGLVVEKFNCRALEWIDISVQHWTELPPRKALWFGEFVKAMPNDHWFVENIPFWMLYNILGYYAYKIDFNISWHPPQETLKHMDNEYNKYTEELNLKENKLQEKEEELEMQPLKTARYNEYGDLSLYRFADWFNVTLKNVLIRP